MKVFRRFVAALLITSSLSAWATDDFGSRVQAKTSEYGDKFGSIWGPLGFTVGGGAATVGGTFITMMGALAVSSSNSYGRAGTGDYAFLAAGTVVLTAGLTLLTVGIVKFVLRSRRLQSQYGD